MASHPANVQRKNRFAAASRAFSASRDVMASPTKNVHKDALCNRCDLRYALHRAKQCGFDALEENEQQVILVTVLTNRAALPFDALRWADSVNGEVLS